MGRADEATLLRDDEATWRAAAAKALDGGAGRGVAGATYDGIAIEPLYRPLTEAAPQPFRRPGAPGTIQAVDHPDTDAARALAMADIDGGASGLSLVVAGAAAARGFGLTLGTAEAVDRLLDGVLLDGIAIRGEGFANLAFDMGAALQAIARRRRLDPSRLNVDFGLDPLGDIARSGSAARPWAEQETASALSYAAIRANGFASPVFRADGRLYHEAGATEAQELAAVMATGVAYLRQLVARDVPLDEATRALSHVLVADVDLVPTAAKFRALRRLWARIENACGLAPLPMRIHAETSWRAMTRRDPWTNILRGTVGCAGAFFGGADSVTVLPFTAALGLPDAAARRLARNTTLILAEESHLAAVADPGAGSGAIEAMTEALCEEAWRLFQIIEAEGGFPQALLSGAWQARVAAAARARRHDVAVGRRLLTGTSHFPHAEETRPSVLMLAQSSAERVGADTKAALRCPALESSRDAEPFERLRDRAEVWRDTIGAPPRVFVLAGCSAFARGLLDVGGLEASIDDHDEGRRQKALRVQHILQEGCDWVAALEALWNEGLVS